MKNYKQVAIRLVGKDHSCAQSVHARSLILSSLKKYIQTKTHKKRLINVDFKEVECL